ncbi:MAG: hypothetical protein KDD47_11095, partial [Acidobacteria bacterium]|nr:hypothetical protein [Acidobacteriota bacterium]
MRNLEKSLDAQAQKKFPRRKAVFATSRRVTPTQRRKLEAKARDRDFVLVQVIDQEGIAELLYRSSRWRKELGITGSASALSAFPKSRRPFLSTTVVGREADLEWLRTTQGDRILSGQPGSGKTFLLHQLASEGRGLFVVQSDESAIKDALLDLRPNESSEISVILDDAHAHLELIASLWYLREQIGRKFSILASCWPGAKAEVGSALGLGRSEIRDLELLTRDEMLQVYSSAGVTLESLKAMFSRPLPEHLLERLLNLAARKPGLAVTLASLVLKGSGAEVLNGRSLLREIKALEGLLGTDPSRTLAAFAAGGKRGMSLEAVASFRGKHASDIQTEVINLAAAGVLEDLQDGHLAVQPRPLGSALLAEVFFRGDSTSLCIDSLIESAPHKASAVSAVIVSREAGAIIDPEKQLELVRQAGSKDVWELF